MFARTFECRTRSIVVVLCLLYLVPIFASTVHGQDEAAADAKIIERYKLMLERKPKEGSTFDRLYQFYLEGAGLDQMVTDYQVEAQAKPNAPNIQLILGHIYKRLGADAETIASYQRAVELAPDDYYPHAALGDAYAMLRRHEDAIAALTQAVELATKSQTATPDDLTGLYKALGRAYFSRDQGDNAISAWEKIAELDPQNIFARIELADLFREQELYDQAIAQHQAIVEIKKEDPYRVCMSQREIGKIQEEKGDYEAALTSYDAALALTAPGNWLRKDLQHRIVGMYAADGNWEGLIAYYNGKLETTPNDPELIGLLAAAHIENQQLDEGIAAYRKGLALAPTDANLRLNLIAALRNAETFAEAAAEYETLSQQHPDDFGIYRELGELYLQLDDEPRARDAYQRMIDRDPQNAGTHLILAEIYAGHEWIDDAGVAYEKAISLAPEHLDYIEYFGEFYLRQGNREQTVETWNRMVAGDLGTAANYDRLAKLFGTKAFHTESVAASRQAVALAPDEYRYREALARLLMENKAYDEALTQYAEAAKLAPNEFFAEQIADQQIEIYRRQGTLVEKLEALENAPEMFDQQKQLAKMYLKLGNISYAVEVLTKAKDFQPNDVRVNRWLAEIYAQQGYRDETVAIYTHLVEIDPENAREYYTAISRALMNVHDFELATDTAKQAIAHSPRNPEGHQLLAEIAKQVGDYQTAIDNLKQAIRLRPEGTDNRAELATIYKLDGNFRQAIEQYWRCWELSDNVGDKLGFVKSLFEAYYDLGRGSEFEEQLKHKSKTNPSDIGPILALAEVYRMASDLPSARFQLTQALDREHDNPDLLGELVKISLDLGDFQDALSYQQRLVKAQPDPTHQQRLGELLFDAGREQEAIQVWTKLLHTKNQPLEAEVKLATVLIRHGLLEEAISVLDRAGEKAKDAKAVYQIGAKLVEMNEFARARPHFEHILQMPKPPEKAVLKPSSTAGQPGTQTHTFALVHTTTHQGNLLQSLARQIQGHPFQPQPTAWIPNSFEEAQAGALVQLKTIAQRQGTLDELIQQLETAADANTKDIQSLERLAQVYTLISGTSTKLWEITNRLIAASPKDPAYQHLRLNQLMQQNPNYETVKKNLDEMTGLTSDKRHWYIARYASDFYRHGKKAEATKLLDELETVKVTNFNTGSVLVETLLLMGNLERAEQVIAQLPTPIMTARPQTSPRHIPSFASQQWWQYNHIHNSLANAYIRTGQADKGVELLWAFLERTKPKATNARRVAPLAYSAHTSSGYTPIQSSYPSPTVYYNQDRLSYLQQIFLQLWTKDRLESLYIKLENELDAAEGRNRIYPSLGLSYCYWWERKREKAQEILSALQNEFSDDLTLKLNTAFVSIQTGQHETALDLLDQLAEVDPQNRRQYYDLTLQLATYTGNTVRVRDLITKMLNAPRGAQELYQFSQKLQESGLTQYAIAVAQKAVPLAIGQRDPNFLMDLSQHLNRLGRGLDAARLAERALRFANQRDRHGQMLHAWNFQRGVNLASRSKALRESEPRLVEAAQKNPDSFQAQVQLATFYQSTKQVKKASVAFEAALALRPKDSITRQRYAQMLEQSGRFEDAAAQYLLLVKSNPNALGRNFFPTMHTFLRAGKVDELVSLAKAMITPSTGQQFAPPFPQMVAQRCVQQAPKAAVEIYEKIIEAYPNSYNTYAELASAYVATGQREKAIQFLREKLETDTRSTSYNTHAQVQIVSKLIELYKASGQIETLVTEYAAKLAEQPENLALRYLVASMKIAANDLEGADSLVNQLLEDGIMNTDWLTNLADAYRRANDRKRELHLLEYAIEKLDPRNTWQLPDIYQKLGDAYARNGEKQKAQKAIRKMGTIRTLRGIGLFWEKANIARIYMQHEMWDDAEVMYTEVLNDMAAARHFREQAQRELETLKQRKNRQTSGRKTTIRKPAVQPPEHKKAMNLGMQRMLVQQQMHRGEYSKAVELYKQIIEAVPEDLESRAQLAKAYSLQNKHEAALAEWQTLLKADPENTKFKKGLVNAYQTAGKIDTAIELAQQYIKADESSVHYALLAKAYAAGDRVDEAIATYKKAIELTPGNVQVYRELAQLYIRNNDFDAAEQAYDEAIQYTGEEWERRNIQREVMELYRRQGKLEEMLQQAEEKGTLTFEMQQERAQKYHAQGELEKAVQAYKKALELTTQHWDKTNISKTLVTIYAQLGQTETALELYDTLSRTSLYGGGVSIRHFGTLPLIQFGNDDARLSLIEAYQNEGKLDDLLAHLEQRLETDADNPATLEIIAGIHRIHEDAVKAAESYQRLCKVQPGNVRSYYYAAAALNKTGQPQLAQKLLKEGEAARATNAQWHRDKRHSIMLGQICVEGELYNAAIQLLENTTSTSNVSFGNDYDQQIRNHTLGQAYLGAKRYTEAIEAYRRLENSAVGDHMSDQMKKIAQAGIRRAYRDGNLSEQLVMEGTQAVAKNPDDPDAHFALAQAYELKEMPNEAIAAYERARALNPESPVILEPLAQLYADADPEKAKPLYKQLIKLEDTPDARIQKRRALIELYQQQGEFDAAISELLNAIRSTEEPIERNAALPALWDIYKAQERTAEGIATLEQLASHKVDNPTLHEVLGDAYTEIGNSEKADAAYTQWIGFREKNLEGDEQWWKATLLVSKLLVKRVMPEKALELAERLSQINPNPFMIPILAEAYLVNGRYQEAAAEFRRVPSRTTTHLIIRTWPSLIRVAEGIEDTEQFTQLVEALVENTPPHAAERVHANLVLAIFHRTHNRLEEAERYMRKSGVVPEQAWWIIGPFDKADDMVATKGYIPEEALEIDTTMRYRGKTEPVSWKQITDETRDGFVDFMQLFNVSTLEEIIERLSTGKLSSELENTLGYAWVSVNSPDEREAQIHISTINATKIWVNGKSTLAIDIRGYGQMLRNHHKASVILQPGENSILVKGSGHRWGCKFCVWLTDTDGVPLEDLTYPNANK